MSNILITNDTNIYGSNNIGNDNYQMRSINNANVFKNIYESTKKQKFWYVIILIILILFFNNYQKININILIGLIIGYCAINYICYANNTDFDIYNNLYDIKNQSINPKINDIPSQNEQLVNFLFSIQDFHKYNPSQYDDMINNINKFNKIYYETLIENDEAFRNYELMELTKRNSLNSLSSILFSLPPSSEMRNKLNSAVEKLDIILTNKLDEISYIMDNNIYTRGYNVGTRIIDYDVKPFNNFTDINKQYTYEVY